MTQIYKTLSTIAILVFGLSFILDKLAILTTYNSDSIRSLAVIIYLFTSLKYYKLVLKDKDAELQQLKAKLNNHN